MKTPLLALLSVFLFAFTCNDDKKEDTNNLNGEVEKAISENVKLAADYEGKYDQILTLEMAAETSGYPATEAKKEPVTEIEKKYNKISVSYSWQKSKRQMIVVVMGNKMEMPKRDEIKLSFLENMSLAEFKQQNHNPTKEELESAGKAINNKLNELENDGKATKDQTTAASSITANAIKNYSVEEVPNVGEYAVFANTKTAGVAMRDLKVYYNGLSFKVTVDLSDDVKFNDDKAITLAKRIINEKLK